MNKPTKHKSSIREKLRTSGDKVRRARLPKRMKIAAKIANALESKDWKSKQLAEGLDKYSSEISKWLKGDHNFTIDTLSDIEEILKINLLNVDLHEEEKTVSKVIHFTLDVNTASEIADAGGMRPTNSKLVYER